MAQRHPPGYLFSKFCFFTHSEIKRRADGNDFSVWDVVRTSFAGGYDDGTRNSAPREKLNIGDPKIVSLTLPVNFELVKSNAVKHVVVL